MVAVRRQGGPDNRSCSWDYSNADSFNDDMYSSMTFYNNPSSSAVHPHYATLPRNFRNASTKKRQRGSEAPPPYAAMEMLLEDYSREHDADSGYGSGTTSPEPPEEPQTQPPTRQTTVLRHKPSVSRRKNDYYYLLRSVPGNTTTSIEHGIGSNPSNPSISFNCTMQPAPLSKKKRRRITNNDISKPDTDPLTYIRDNCENATRALSSHRKLHGCDCDFAYLDDRQRGTGSVWRREEAEQGVPVPRAGFGPKRPCRKRWFTGWFVRQHMKFHDQYCACGCFGVKR